MSLTLALNAIQGETGEEENSSLVDGAYAALRQAIREHVLPPGHRANEADIARQLGMSRTPVHEAIIRLQAEGLVKILSRRGVLICSISADDINEIYEVLIAIEGMAAALLARLGDNERSQAITLLEQATTDMENSLIGNNLQGWAAADDKFHTLLTGLCGNKRIAHISATVREQSCRSRLYTLHLRQTPVDSTAEHRQIINSIAAGDAENAEKHARDHRLRARDCLVPLIRQSGMKNM